VYLAGARVDRLYALAPPSGAACNVALLSHCGTCCIGVNVDTAAVPDPDALVEDLRAGFDEVVAAGRPARRRSPRRVS
jgi:diacylglycerol O-acyltransferase